MRYEDLEAEVRALLGLPDPEATVEWGFGMAKKQKNANDLRPLSRAQRVGLADRGETERYDGKDLPSACLEDLNTKSGMRKAEQITRMRKKARAGRREGMTILSTGLGRDSTTIIALLAMGKLCGGGMLIKPEDVDAVVFSDTGYEWSFTYAVLPVMEHILGKLNIPFYVLSKPPKHLMKEGRDLGWAAWAEKKRKNWIRLWKQSGAHKDPDKWTRAWTEKLKAVNRQQGLYNPPWVEFEYESLMDKARSGGYHTRAPLVQQFSAYDRMNLRSSVECTDAHKIQPVERLINDMTEAKYGVSLTKYKQWVEEGKAWPHKMIIGFAYDEPKRVRRGLRTNHEITKTGNLKFWWKDNIYPLAEMGITKEGEAEVLKAYKYKMPGKPERDLNWIRKSGCFVCHFQPESWFWALSVMHPDVFEQVVKYERKALTRNPKWFLKGKTPIRESVRKWRAKNPLATPQQVLNKSYCRDKGGLNRLRGSSQGFIPVVAPAWRDGKS